MREIKFRGLDVSLDAWRYGSLRKMNGGCEISWFSDDGIYHARFVKPETVGQYTGLKDKNGREIYEGDVISLRDEDWEDNIIKNVIVKYEPGSFFVKFDGFKYSLWACYDYDIKIIGNVYDNP